MKKWLEGALITAIAGAFIFGVVVLIRFFTRPVYYADAAPKHYNNQACKKFDNGFTCSVVMKPSDKVPRGELVSQSVPAGTKVKFTTPIELVYSSGPAHSKVPEIRGETEEKARHMLDPLGFDLFIDSTVDSPNVAQGRIVTVKPAVGTQVSNGAKIKVSVSSGKVSVPDWKGKSRAEIQSDADNSGIMVRFDEVPSNAIPGTAVSQSAKGHMDNSLSVSVSLAKPQKTAKITVPKVRGMATDKAMAELATAGFSLMETSGQGNKVCDVTPQENAHADSSTHIVLTLCK